MLDFISDCIESLGNFLRLCIDHIWNLIVELGQYIISGFTIAIEFFHYIYNFFLGLFPQIWTWIVALWHSFSSWITDLYDSILIRLTDLIPALDTSFWDKLAYYYHTIELFFPIDYALGLVAAGLTFIFLFIGLKIVLKLCPWIG